MAKKRYLEKNVYELALERIEDAYERFDDHYVLFSGGKDSTLVLELVIQVATKLNRLPVKAIFRDEEAIPPIAIDFVKRTADRPEVDMYWYAVPLESANGASSKSSTWIAWDTRERERWIREKPEWAIKELPGYDEDTVVSQLHFERIIFPDSRKTICEFQGIRAAESLQRYASVTSKVKDNYIAKTDVSNVFMVKPIYDWEAQDLWLATKMFGWEHNPIYELERLYGFNLEQQRLATPYGKEALKSLPMYRVLFPDFYEKCLLRVDGVHTATEYAGTKLYGAKKYVIDKGSHDTWEAYAMSLLKEMSPEDAALMADIVRRIVVLHRNKSTDPIPYDVAHPDTGVSWKIIIRAILKRDFKGKVLPSIVPTRKYLDVAKQ